MAKYEVVILKEGYCREVTSSLFAADCTITLIKGPNTTLVDTGNPSDADFLMKGLSDHKVKPEDVRYVIATHGHIDHVGNLNLFPRATVMVGTDVCRGGDEYDVHDFTAGRDYEIDEDVRVVYTPGHTGSDVSVVIKNTNMGTVVVAGDVFEREEDLEEPSIWMNMSENPEQQEKSRLKILSLADVVVPGHGPQFLVKPGYKRHISVEEIIENDDTNGDSD